MSTAKLGIYLGCAVYFYTLLIEHYGMLVVKAWNLNERKQKLPTV